MDGGIFISYRRDDTRQAAGRLADDLGERFGAARIFRDVEAIGAGVEFPQALQQALSRCELMLVLIGRQWATAVDAQGRRRLDEPGDWVRAEIAAALARGIRVVPVLVDDAALPAPDQLPVELRPLLRRQAFELEDSRWKSDVARLVDALSAEGAGAVRPRRRLGPALLAGPIGVAALAGLAVWAMRPANVAGDWVYAPDDEVYTLAQDGQALTVELRTSGRWTGVGTGRLDGDDVRLTIELGLGGPRMDCRLRRIARDRLDGPCEAPGQRYELALTRRP